MKISAHLWGCKCISVHTLYIYHVIWVKFGIEISTYAAEHVLSVMNIGTGRALLFLWR